jgi:predicted HAD superfamily Cof-like phosphohydrolase
MNSLESSFSWHVKATPSPEADDFRIQFAVHCEEIAEMFDEIIGTDIDNNTLVARIKTQLQQLSSNLKNKKGKIGVKDRKSFVDALADQCVTCAGVAWTGGFDLPKALTRVNESNWTKIDPDTNDFVRDKKTGKILKPASYSPPDLEGCY